MENLKIPILYQNKDFVVVYKAAGMHVHQPEFPRRRVDPSKVLMVHLRRQLKQRIYPVHRLDVATEGLLVVALSGEAAGRLNRVWAEAPPEKVYYCLVRGFTDAQGIIETPLSLDSTGEMVDCKTEYWKLGQMELPHAVGKKHSTARYSFLRAQIFSGRWHQVRRHLRDIAHPIVGDREHGDSYHNRFFRETLGRPGLWLFAKNLTWQDPVYGKLEIEMPWTPKWLDLFQTYPNLAPKGAWHLLGPSASLEEVPAYLWDSMCRGVEGAFLTPREITE